MVERLDFVGIGGLAGDLVIQMDELPGHDAKYFVPPGQKVAGGFIANGTVAAARLGMQTGYVGWVGDDGDGHWLAQTFLDEGITRNNLGMIYDLDLDTPINIVMLDRQGNRAIVIPSSPLYMQSLNQDQLALVSRAKVAYSYPRDVQWVDQLAEATRTGGGMLALDCEATYGLSRQDFDYIAAQADTLFVSDAIMTEWGYKALKAIPATGWVIQTVGSRGAYGYDRKNDKDVFQPAFEVDVVDTTGAGDCFHTAVLYGKIKGWPLEQAMRFASAAAALSVQQMGARGGLPRLDEVMQFLEEHA